MHYPLQERSETKKVNRAKNKLTHVMGSKTFVVAREEMVMIIKLEYLKKVILSTNGNYILNYAA